VLFGRRVLESILVSGNMGFFMVHSDAAQKIQVEIWLAFCLINVWINDFLCYSIFADTIKPLCLPAIPHKAVRDNY